MDSSEMQIQNHVNAYINKAAQETDNLTFRDGLEQGYNKAIDEFAEQLRLRCLDSVYKEVSTYAIFEIAQQLKEGGTDE